MKKLIAIAAFAFSALFANAATYNWEVSFAASPDGENPLVGIVYAFDANAYSYATMSAALSTTGATALGNALGQATIDDAGLVLVSGSGLTDDGGSTALTASMYAIIVSQGSDSKNYFFYQNFDDVTITDAVIADKAVFGTDYVGTGAVGGAGWTEVGGGSAVPEPTSGLLMLLGVAGLALKRKRA